MIAMTWTKKPSTSSFRRAQACTDHHLVTARVRPKLRRAGPKNQTSKLGTISADYMSTFVLLLRERFQALSHTDKPEDEEEDAVNRQWNQVWSIFDEYLYLSV